MRACGKNLWTYGALADVFAHIEWVTASTNNGDGSSRLPAREWWRGIMAVLPAALVIFASRAMGGAD